MADLTPVSIGEVRALMVHDVVPAGHVAVPIVNDRWAPHLRSGEFAVIDTSDIEPQLGELFGLMIQSPRHQGGHVLRVVQPCRAGFGDTSDGAVMFRFEERRAGALSYIDGPLSPRGWSETCRGRVVGVLSPLHVEVDHG